MARQDQNAALAATSFLYGANAPYIEELQARYAARPVLGRRGVARLLRGPPGRAERRRADGPSWQRPDWPVVANGELVAALDGNWAGARGRSRQEDQGRRRSPRRRNLRRAGPAGGARFGPRHHDDPRLPHARPLLRQSRSARPRAAQDRRRPRPGLLRLHRGRLRPEDLHRPRARARVRDRPARCSRSCGGPIAARSASSSCTSPTRPRRAGSRSASKGPDKGIAFTPEGKKAILNKLVEAEGFEKFLDVKYTGTKRFGLDGGEVADPGARADHQARRRSSACRRSCSAWRIAAGSTCSPR